MSGTTGKRLYLEIHAGSDAERSLAWQLDAVKIPYEREVQFARILKRRWRADFVVRPEGPCGWNRGVTGTVCRKSRKDGIHPFGLGHHDYEPTASMEAALLIEIDGATWTGGRHVTGRGHAADAEKRNAAVLLGYRPLTFSPEQVESGEALSVIEKALA